MSVRISQAHAKPHWWNVQALLDHAEHCRGFPSVDFSRRRALTIAVEQQRLAASHYRAARRALGIE